MTDFFTARYAQVKQLRARERQKAKLKSIAPHLDLLDIERAMSSAYVASADLESKKK
jgi:hypothetical protein